jgi:hypothetical protein
MYEIILSESMILNESILRRVIRDEIRRKMMYEAIIRRRGGEETRIADPVGTSAAMLNVPAYYPVKGIQDTKTSPNKLMTIMSTADAMSSPFVPAGPGSLFDKMYNQGTAEEEVGFTVKKKSGERVRMPKMLKSYNFKEGTNFIIPTLYNYASHPSTVDLAFGVGTLVLDPENYPTGVSGMRAPLALVEFSDSQKPDRALSRHGFIGVAFLQWISSQDAIDYASDFRAMKQKNMRSSPVYSFEDDED